MSQDDGITGLDVSALRLIYYPDPRLKEICTAVQDPADRAVRRLLERMWELIVRHKGVGLAGPQVGVTARLFVTSPTCQSGDLHAAGDDLKHANSAVQWWHRISDHIRAIVCATTDNATRTPATHA